MSVINSLNKGEVYILKGNATFKVVKGELEVIGKRFSDGDEEFIPLGKSVPLEVVKDSEVSFSDIKEEQLKKVDNRTIPEEWDKLLDRIKNEADSKIIIFGEMDTGKSFFTTYLTNKLIAEEKKVGVIDTDTGQTEIGPPTTIGLSVLDKQVLTLQQAEVHSIEFVGSLSPALHFLPMVVCFSKIVEKAEKVSNVIIVNTNGWVHGDGGRSLKQAKIDILNPDIVVLLQREDECEPLVKSVLPKSKIVRLKVSKNVSETSKVERESLRNLVSQRYFGNSKRIELNFKDFDTERVYFKTGKRVIDIPNGLENNIIYMEKFPAFEGYLIVSKQRLSVDEYNILKDNNIFNVKNFIKGKEKGFIVGLLDENKNLMGLGIVDDIDFINEKIYIRTTIKEDSSRIKIVQFGSILYTEEGKENGFIEPGYF